ncbi:MAG TPA: phosphatidate cytidylyltransferase [Flavobacteriales bacterium]
MSNFVTRILAGIVFIATVMGAAWAGPLALGMLFLFFAAVGLHEFYVILHRDKALAPRWWAGMLTGLLLYLAVFIQSNDGADTSLYWFMVIPVAVVMFSEMFRTNESKNIVNLALTTFGWGYVIFPLALINVLGQVHGEYDWHLVLGYFLLLWSNDSGAYAFGRMLGRTKLFERVSPNKTWEGLIGGVAFTLFIAWVLSHSFDTIELKDWMAVAIIIGVFANLGDLFESHIKRMFGVKDSGSIIPGHGGVLDRFDGLLLSLPIVIAYFKIITSL